MTSVASSGSSSGVMTRFELRASVQSDLKRLTGLERHSRRRLLRYIVVNKGFRAVFLHRLIRYHACIGREATVDFLKFINTMFSSIEISEHAVIDAGLLIPHPQCIVIGRATLGRNVTIQQGVTIGSNLGKESRGSQHPEIGDNVLIGAGAKIIGPVRIGDNSIIGANAVVTEDIPRDSVAVGIPARVTRENPMPYPELLDNRAALRLI